MSTITTVTLFLMTLTPNADFAAGNLELKITDAIQGQTALECLEQAQAINSIPQRRVPGDVMAVCVPDQPHMEL